MTSIIKTRVDFYVTGLDNPSVAIDSCNIELDIFEIIRTQNVVTYECYNILKDLSHQMKLNPEHFGLNIF